MIPTPKYRDYFLSDEITGATVKPLVDFIFDINFADDLAEKDYKDWERLPIKIFINSPGGNVYDGLALVDTIKRSKTPVHTIAIGHAMSMGLWIYSAGHKRFVGENATLMWHDITSWNSGKTAEIKQELNEVLRLQQMSMNAITHTSLITEDQLKDYINRKAEWYIPAEEAIKLHLADEYYK